jgi:CRISPR-associated protein Csm1
VSSRSPLPTRDEIALGAFLHDIGKLAQRAHGSAGLLQERWPAVFARASDVLPSFNGRSTHWHALWSDWVFETLVDKAPLPKEVDSRWVRDCAVYHHRPLSDGVAVPNGSISWLVAEADRIASGMERKQKDAEAETEGEARGAGRDAYRRTLLASLFGRVSIDAAKSCPANFVQPLREIAADALDPEQRPGGQDPNLPEAYQALWEGFAAGYRELAARVEGDLGAFHEGLIALSERFLWAVPSSTVDDPDVGLHDHARAVAAVAAALHAHHEHAGDLNQEAAIRDRGRSKLRFLVGDLSGIQTALFRLASEGASGLARVLRGRSLRIQLIAEAAAREALAAFRLPPYNLLQIAGGRFLILLPTTEPDRQRAELDGLRSDVDLWLRAQYEGDLVLNLSLTPPFSAAEMLDAARRKRVLASIGQAAEEAKQRPLAGAPRPISETKWNPDVGPCTTCGVRPAASGRSGTETPPRCVACEAETRIGRAFPKAAAIVLDTRGIPDSSKADRILGLNIGLPDNAYPLRAARGWRLRGREDHENLPAADRFAGAYVPRHVEETLQCGRLRRIREEADGEDAAGVGDVLTFAELAELSREERGGGLAGRPMLAALKADVDHLGQVFSRGLGDRRSLARAAALSRMMDAFFSGFLPFRLERDFKHVYTVYAGGDDLFLLGPWLDILQLAGALREDFRRFVGKSPHVTLSAGVALFDPRTPVARAAKEADERLDRAKDDGRDRVHAVLPVGAPAMTWAAYGKALEDAERLDELLRDPSSGVTTALAYRLLHFDDQRRRATEDKDMRAADWRAKLGYHLWRALPRRGGETGRRNDETRAFLLGLMGVGRDLDPVDGAGDRAAARLALSIAIYRNR